MANVLKALNKGIPFFQSQIPSSGNKSFLQYKKDLERKNSQTLHFKAVNIILLLIQEKTYDTSAN